MSYKCLNKFIEACISKKNIYSSSINLFYQESIETKKGANWFHLSHWKSWLRFAILSPSSSRDPPTILWSFCFFLSFFLSSLGCCQCFIQTFLVRVLFSNHLLSHVLSLDLLSPLVFSFCVNGFKPGLTERKPLNTTLIIGTSSRYRATLASIWSLGYFGHTIFFLLIALF